MPSIDFGSISSYVNFALWFFEKLLEFGHNVFNIVTSPLGDFFDMMSEMGLPVEASILEFLLGWAEDVTILEIGIFTWFGVYVIVAIAKWFLFVFTG